MAVILTTSDIIRMLPRDGRRRADDVRENGRVSVAVTLFEGSRDLPLVPSTGSLIHPWLYAGIPPGFAVC